jgi:hypothetical protein
VPSHTMSPMTDMRGEERWVAACIEAALPGVTAVQHDDGTRPSMYDLDLVRDGVPIGACEVTAAADAESIELWNLINGSDERWIEQGLGGWLITVGTKCRARRLKKELPALLRTLEAIPSGPEREEAISRLEGLEVVSARPTATNYSGWISITLQRDPERTGGMVPTTGNGLVTWLDAWMHDPAQEHNLAKLRAADRGGRHLFVLFPGFTTAPFNASDVLMIDSGPLPEIAPVLPESITDVWLMSTWSSGDLFHYGTGGWTRSSKVFEVAAD